MVWALLLYRAAGAKGPLPVAFGVHLSGRDLPLRGAAGIPGLLGNPLPMTVTVDPAAPLVDLLLRVRDAALDLSAYAWVGGDQVRRWSGRAPGSPLTESTVCFEGRFEPPVNLRAELAAQGIGAGTPHSAGGATALPITLVAHHDSEGCLVLSALYDRARFTDTDASDALAQCLHLLRGLPDHPDRAFTVADALRLLGTSQVPAMTEPAAASTALAAHGAAGRGTRGGSRVPAHRPRRHPRCVRHAPAPVRGARTHRLAHGRRGAGRRAALEELLGQGRRLTVCGAGPA